MRNKQEELEFLTQSQCYDILVLCELWWNGSHDCSAEMGGYRLLGRDMQGRRGDGIALCVRECLDCFELSYVGERVVYICVRIRGKVEVCYRPPNQDAETD